MRRVVLCTCPTLYDLSNPDLDDSRGIEKTSPTGDPRSHEIGRSDHGRWQPGGNSGRPAELEQAIANLTRLLGSADDADTAAELVRERRAMRKSLTNGSPSEPEGADFREEASGITRTR